MGSVAIEELTPRKVKLTKELLLLLRGCGCGCESKDWIVGCGVCVCVVVEGETVEGSRGGPFIRRKIAVWH